MSQLDEAFFKEGEVVYLNYAKHLTDTDKQRYRDAVRFFEALLTEKKKLMLFGGTLSYKTPYLQKANKESILKDAQVFRDKLKDLKADPSLSAIVGVITNFYSRVSGSGLKYFIVVDPSHRQADYITPLKIGSIWRDTTLGRGYHYSKNKGSDRVEREERIPGRLGFVTLKDDWKVLEVCSGLGRLTSSMQEPSYDTQTQDCFVIERR